MATTDSATQQLARQQQPGNGTDVEKRPAKPAFVQLLEENEGALAGALPQAGVTPQQLIRVAVTCVRDNPTLGRCSPQSIAGALMQAAHVGLLPGGTLGHAHLAPYWNRDTKSFEAQFQLGWQGYVQLARRSGEVQELWADVIHEKDTWEIKRGLDRDLIHEPAWGEADRGNVIFAYAVVKYTSGARDWVVLDRADLEKRKNMSQTGRKNQGPWADHFEAMCRKSAIKALAPFMPLSLDDMRAFSADGGVVRWDPSQADHLEPVDPDRVDDIDEAQLVDLAEVGTGQDAPAEASGDVEEPEESANEDAPEPDHEPLDPADLRKKNVGELKQLCYERGLPRSGTKGELIAHLTGVDPDDDAEPEEAPVESDEPAPEPEPESTPESEPPTDEPNDAPDDGAQDVDVALQRRQLAVRFREHGITKDRRRALLAGVYGADSLDDLDPGNVELLLEELSDPQGAERLRTVADGHLSAEGEDGDADA